MIKAGRRGGEVSAALQAERVATRDDALAPAIVEIRASGVTSARGIAKALNERGIPTATGRAKWRANTVHRLLTRLARIAPASGA
jgi:Recombinase